MNKLINLNQTKPTIDTIFHFENSLERFVLVNVPSYDFDIFVSLDSGIGYTWDDICGGYNSEYLFYMDEDDDDFYGVSTEF